MKTFFIANIFLWFLSFTDTNKLTGRWESKESANGNITGIVFKTDGSFEGYINRKPFTSGSYTFENNIFSFTDNGCAGMKGSYKTIFSSNDDSLRFEVAEDSCTERKEGIARIVLGRVRKPLFTNHSIFFIK